MKTCLAAVFVAGQLLVGVANGENLFPDQMSMDGAIDAVLAQVEKANYKDIEVMTTAGSFSGEFVKKSGEVLILKKKTGSIHLATQKEKARYMVIDLKEIAGISFYRLD